MAHTPVLGSGGCEVREGGKWEGRGGERGGEGRDVYVYLSLSTDSDKQNGEECAAI